ncbi:MAG: T9SS C-terminal target domain-containing protein [Balneolaceae bacterium]|nr:MAG: T9SS C-terminal target domain-containing protein [Balneolaceae bacterium]
MKLKFSFFLSVLLFLPLFLIAQDTIDVTFRYVPSDNAVRSFVPGSFNDWGNNQAGQISPTDGSLLTVDEENGFSYQVVELEIGGGSETYQGTAGYAYKFHEHYNQSGTEFQWFTDPLNPIAIGPNADSFIEVTHPLIFQVVPQSRSVKRDSPPGITATVAAKSDDPISVSGSSIYVNGTMAGSFDGFYETDRQLLMVPSISDLGIDLNIGENTLRIVAVTDAGETKEQEITFSFIATPEVVEETRPFGLEDGITYHDDDPSKISFSIFAPGKDFVHVIGDHSDWQVREEYLMKLDSPAPDSAHFWITIDDFTPGESYRFQYLVDGELRLADPFSELVLNPSLDQYISESVYPDMPQYPSGLTSEIVTVIEPGREAFEWEVPDFERPKVEDLIIYELLLRDFVENSTYETLRDTLDYLENLGVNAIELMPVSEFDGNLSWGYNPVFHGALDKSYGNRESFKKFINEAHKRGMAVILDVVYNHAHENSSLIRLYGESRDQNRFIGPGHAFNVFQHLNHDDPYIKYWLDRMNRYWIETYKVDGYRFDLTKGFATNVQDGSLLQGPNPERIVNLKRMYDRVREYDDDAYMILEHFAANSEERELEEYGMLLWGNHNFNYSEGVMGYNDGNKSNFSGIYFGNRNFQNPHLVGYMESHDEQWMMRKMREFGDDSNPEHSTRDLDVALQRMKLAGAFFLTIPGPKMLWQFGELGYGWGDGECLKPGDGSDGDCSPTDPGRTAEKPVRWEYYDQENRYRLYRSWSELNRLRRSSPAFSSAETQFNSSLRGEVKWITLEHPDMDVVIVGNFGVNFNEFTVDFTGTGDWHEFVSGSTTSIETDLSKEFNLAPGEFRIFTSEFVEPAEENVFFKVGESDFTTLPDEFILDPNYPNPFNPGTTLRYSVPEQAPVRIDVYDILGRRVTTLLDVDEHPAGVNFTVNFDATGLSSGVYIARMVSGSTSRVQKMTFVK